MISIAAIQQWLILHPGWVIAAIGGVSFMESFALLGIAVPGVAILAAAGFAAGATDIPLFGCLAAAWAGAVAGDGASYLLGRVFHADIKGAWPFRTHPQWIADAERYFLRYGAWSVAIGRFVGPIRPVIPLVAGILSMPAQRFFLINLLSALVWAPLYLAPGYWLGTAVGEHFAPPGLLIGGALAALAIGAFILWRQRHRFRPTTPPDAP